VSLCVFGRYEPFNVIIGDWIVFEPKVKQTPLRIVSDKEFKINYEKTV
jgi:hypothetical protein